MNNNKFSAPYFGELAGPTQDRFTVFSQVDRAGDAFVGLRGTDRDLGYMGSRKDRACYIMENLAGDRSENEAPKRSVAMSREDDEIRLCNLGQFFDLLGRVTLNDQFHCRGAEDTCLTNSLILLCRVASISASDGHAAPTHKPLSKAP